MKAEPRFSWWDLVRTRRSQVLLGLIIGAAALVLALWGVPLREVGHAIGQTRFEWLVLTGALFWVQQGIRAWRQTLILQAVVPHHRFRTSLSVLCVSFFFINTLPARLGELARPLLLTERDGTPLGTGLALVVVERAIDLLAMLVMIALVAWLVPVPSHTLEIQGHVIDWVALGKRAASFAVPAVLLGLMGLVWLGRPALDRLTALAPRLGLARLVGPIARIGASFLDGLGAIKQPGRLAAIVALTVLCWGLTAGMYPIAARAFGFHDRLTMGPAVGLLAITMLGMTVPSAPGFAGTYEAFVRGALALFGVAGAAATYPGGPSLDATAVAFALVFHWWIYFVQSLSAVYFIAVDRFDPARLLQGLRDNLAPGSVGGSESG